jgi:hypothetical protein
LQRRFGLRLQRQRQTLNLLMEDSSSLGPVTV